MEDRVKLDWRVARTDGGSRIGVAARTEDGRLWAIAMPAGDFDRRHAQRVVRKRLANG